jgi:nicotinamidase-related amidase
VVGVQDQQQVERLRRHRVDHVVLGGTAKNMCSMFAQ